VASVPNFLVLEAAVRALPFSRGSLAAPQRSAEDHYCSIEEWWRMCAIALSLPHSPPTPATAGRQFEPTACLPARRSMAG